MRERWFWPAVAASICAVDVYAILAGLPTLSTQVREAVKHPYWRWPVAASWLYLSGHLLGLVPAERDPLSRLGRRLERLIGRP